MSRDKIKTQQKKRGIYHHSRGGRSSRYRAHLLRLLRLRAHDDGEARGISGLARLGCRPCQTAKEIVLPETLGGVLAEYNELQKQQGFDLSQYCGEVCESYTYMLNSYPSGETGVIAQLFIYKGRVIGGDIHSASLGGFMHGLS